MNDLCPTDAAYIAGLIDGEGTITLSRKHANEKRSLCVSICSTERVLLEFVLSSVGAGRITTKRTYRDHHSPSFTWRLTNRQALQLLVMTAPFLKTYKANRAALALEKYLALTPRNGKYSVVLTRERDQFEQELLGMRANPR